LPRLHEQRPAHLEALNVLAAPSRAQSLFDVPISDMTDAQLDEALRLVRTPSQQPLINQCGEEIVGDKDAGV